MSHESLDSKCWLAIMKIKLAIMKSGLAIMYTCADAKEYSFYMKKACNWGGGGPPQLHAFSNIINYIKRINIISKW